MVTVKEEARTTKEKLSDVQAMLQEQEEHIIRHDECWEVYRKPWTCSTVNLDLVKIVVVPEYMMFFLKKFVSITL